MSNVQFKIKQDEKYSLTMFTSEIELTLEMNMVIRTSTGSPAIYHHTPNIVQREPLYRALLITIVVIIIYCSRDITAKLLLTTP